MISETQKEANMVSDSPCTLENVRVGDRIECSGYIGTVKYIGPVEKYPSNWLGIDWDDQYRGKHDGKINGIQYFHTRFPKSGSFVRPEKVELGHSILESINARYGKNENQLTSQEFEQKLFSFKQSINAPFLEMVGFEKVLDKQSNFGDLSVVNLRLQNINSAGEPDELKSLCPNIRELDLSKNLISSWITVFEICSQLDRLSWLNLSENLLTIPENIEDCYCFPSIETLILTSMNLSWAEILKITVAFPNLKELRVPFNDIRTLDTSSDSLQNLRVLDVEDNILIEEWSEICKLSVLEHLEELFLGNIALKRIEFEGETSKVEFFKNLKKLSISHNLIDNWESVNELNRLKSLEDLRFVKNPILESQSEATRFQIVVARIENLKLFNGTEIKPDMRRGAEYDYLKMYGLAWLKVKDSPEKNSFLKLHNRYFELIEKYGAPEESELVVKPKSIKNTLISVDLVYDNETVSKKLPETIVIQKVMLLVQKLFCLNDRPNLIYVSAEDSNFRISLDEQRELGFYSLKDGDKIIIDTS